MLVPSSLALITATFGASERGAAIGSWTAWTGIALVVGPLGGGALVQLVSWRWIFAINVPLVLATLAVARAGVQESVDEESTRRVDYLGAVLVSLGLAGPVFALIEQPVYGFGDPLVWVPFVAGLVLLGAFVWHEHRSDHPMLPLSLFRSRNFAVGNLATLGIYGGLGGALFFVTIFLQQVAGYTAIEAGLSLMPITVVMWLLSRRWGALSDRHRPAAADGLRAARRGRRADLDGRAEPGRRVRDRPAAGRARVRARALGDGGAADQHRARARCRSTTRAWPRASTTRSRASPRCWRSPCSAPSCRRSTRTRLRENAATLPPPSASPRCATTDEVLAGGRGQPAPVREAVQDASVSAYRLGLGVGGGLVIARRRRLAGRHRQPAPRRARLRRGARPRPGPPPAAVRGAAEAAHRDAAAAGTGGCARIGAA